MRFRQPGAGVVLGVAILLVIATGAWAAPGLGLLGIAAQVWRKVLFWYDTPEPGPFLADTFPTFFVEKDYGHFYGFPSVDNTGLSSP